jgi:hypothetical protein
MTHLFPLTSAGLALAMVVALSACSSQEEMAKKPAAKPAPAAKAAEAPAPAKAEAPAKAKTTKASKVTQITPTPAKISDVGLGSSATVTYQSDKGKNVATGVEFKAAKGE